MAQAIGKTNVVRILENMNIAHQVYTYDSDDGKIDGVSVAAKVGKDPETVYKTLVTQANEKNLYVFIIPVAEELDLKKAAAVVGEKKIEMIAVKDINRHTGYIRGGCSPVGMKKLFPTVVDETAILLDQMIVSAGKIGVQVELNPDDLLRITEGKYADIIK